MSSPAILVENVTVHYGEVLALDSASLTLDAARICGLIGMNGSGKSTLFKVIMGMIKPDAGRVLINGASPAKARKEGESATSRKAKTWTGSSRCPSATW